MIVLRDRNFSLFWVAGVINALGDYVLIAALPFYIYRSSGSALLTGALFMVQMVPPILLGSVAGVYVDRWDKQRTLVLADLALALVLLPLLAIHGRSLTWIAIVVALMEAAIFQFVPPAAGALQTAVVDRERLGEANAVRSAGFNAAVLIGPPLGALLVASLGLSAVVLADVASYAVAGLIVLFMRVRGVQSEDTARDGLQPPRFWIEWWEGLTVVRTSRELLGLFSVQGISMLGAGMVWVTLIVFTERTLHGGTLEYGWWLSLNALGGLFGSAIVGFLARRLLVCVLIASGLIGIGLAWLALVLLASLPALLALAPLVAVAGVMWSVSAGTMLQQEAPQEFLGRVLGAYGALGSLAVLFGLGLASLLGGRVDPRLLLGLAGVLDIVAGLTGTLMLRPVATSEQAWPSCDSDKLESWEL